MEINEEVSVQDAGDEEGEGGERRRSRQSGKQALQAL